MRRPDQRGETLVEVVMALGILSLVLVSSYALATSTFRQGRGAGERTQAVNYLQQQAEALRTYRDQVSWDEFKTAMNTYIGKSFCMKQTTVLSQDVWRTADPQTAGSCVIDDVVIGIEPVSVATQEPSTQYNFTLTAVWKTGAQENNVSLTTKLVKQD